MATIAVAVLASTSGRSETSLEVLEVLEAGARRCLYLDLVVSGQRFKPPDVGPLDEEFTFKVRVLVDLRKLTSLCSALADVCRGELLRGTWCLGADGDTVAFALEPRSLPGSFDFHVDSEGSFSKCNASFITDLTCLEQFACSLESVLKQTGIDLAKRRPRG